MTRDADLRDSDLRYADMRDPVSRGAFLRGADVRGVNLGDADVPVIAQIHQRVYAAAKQPGALDMRDWHRGTKHCRAGLVVTLAGEEGKNLERRVGTPAAAMAIYTKSDPKRWSMYSAERLPDFFCTAEEALADMKRLAEAEARGYA